VLSVLRPLKTYPDLNFSLLLDITAIDYLQYPHPPARFTGGLHPAQLAQELAAPGAHPGPDPEAGLDSVPTSGVRPTGPSARSTTSTASTFNNHPDLRRILNHWQFEGHPLRKDYDIFKGQICYDSDSLEKEIKARLAEQRDRREPPCGHQYRDDVSQPGPVAPATHGAIRIFTALDGETIMANVNEIGYLHRGFEKTAENRTYNQIIPLTDRLNYCSALMNNIAYVKAVESWLGVEITERAKIMRVILSEFFRVQDHLVCLAANLVDMGGLTNYWYLYNEKEASYDLISRLTGARLTSSFTRIGGMYRDFYEGWEADMEHQLKAIEKGVNDSLKLVLQNRIVHDRTQGTCVLSPEVALSYGYTGPNLRSTGVAFDLRKDNPYYHYETFDFSVPVGSQGDIYDRIMVRFEEIFESIKIIRQAMKIVPEGPVFVDDHRVALPDKARSTTGSRGWPIISS
jgi:NADH-quinone oxidoreductase subunit C/D